MDTTEPIYGAASNATSDLASNTTPITTSPSSPSSPSTPIRHAPRTTTNEPTRTSLVALTTPFVQTGSCNNLYSTTYISTNLYWVNNDTSVTLYISDTEDPSFTACQPLGWASVTSTRRNTFSPAVCPSDWTAYKIGPMYSHDTDKNAEATALCCTRDFSPQAFKPGITASGFPDSVEACMSAGATPTNALYPTEYHVHAPFKAVWQHTDVSTLSPPPPDITCGQSLGTWVPGETVPPLPCYTEQPVEHPDFTGLAFAMIGVPVIVGVALLCCCGYCFHRIQLDKDRERTERRMRLELEERQAATAQQVAHSEV